MLTAAWVVTGVFFTGGTASLIAVAWKWKAVGRRVGDWWAKGVAKVTQFASAGVGIGSAAQKAAGGDAAEWLSVSAAAAAAMLLWGLVEVLIDSRVKAADRADREGLTAAQRRVDSLTELLAIFRDLADSKVKRLTASLEPGRQNPSIERVRDALAPRQHVEDVLQSLALYFRAKLPGDARAGNFRVVLYASHAGRMVVTHAVNLNEPGVSSFKSCVDPASAKSFELSAEERPAMAVVCIRRKEMLIEPDCILAADEGRFHFYHDDQRGYLRSLLALPMGKICGADGELTDASLVIDTNQPNFFTAADRDHLELTVREFASRVRLELLLDTFLTKKRA